MAEIRKVVRSNPLSGFSQVTPASGTAFALLGDLANQAYDFMLPIGDEETAQQADLDAREYARQQFGRNRVAAPPAQGPDGGLAGVGQVAPGTGETPAGRLTGPPAVATSALVREFEGFRETPYWDVNALRTGYGSDTITAPDGTFRRVQEGDRVSREDAERDLQRRLSTEFIPIAARAIGDTFAALSSGQQAALGSIAYNYGEIPARIINAVRSGNPQTAAAAISALGGDNGGVNADRRRREAEIFSGDTSDVASIVADTRTALGTPTTAPGVLTSPDAPQTTISAMGPSTTTPLAAPAPTMIRNAQGQLEARLYSPASQVFGQVYNATFKMAYLSEAMLAGQSDLMALSEQFAMQPEAFLEAARGYVDQAVSQADPMLQRDLRGAVETEAQRRYLGMLDDVHTDTRQRADNSSAALIDRLSGDMANAMASGDTSGASAARSQLEGLLYARESLPGVAWTRAQSENTILGAIEQSSRIQQTRRDQQASEWRGTLDTIIAARENGMTGADESLLDNPEVWAADPERATEAAAWIEFRTEFPAFDAMTPDQQAAALQDMQAVPVQDEYDIKMYETATAAAARNREGWAEDQVAQAARVFPQNPPPPLPDPLTASPQEFVEALRLRREYMNGLVTQGYVDRPTFLSNAEAEAMSTLMGKDFPAADRLDLAAALVAGFGDQAVGVFGELDIDPVMQHGGRMMAMGGSAAHAEEALRGQQMIDEELVSIPAALTQIEAVAPEISDALTGLPADDVQITADVLAFASGIYANRARGLDPASAEAKDVMGLAIQQALGQDTNSRDQTTGGVQTIAGHPVLLPVGVVGDDVNRALRGINNLLPGGNFMQPFEEMRNILERGPAHPPATQWLDVQPQGVTASLPYAGDKVLDRSFMASGDVRLVPMGGDTYRMEITRSGAVVDVATADGNVFLIDIKRLMEAVRP